MDKSLLIYFELAYIVTKRHGKSLLIYFKLEVHEP